VGSPFLEGRMNSPSSSTAFRTAASQLAKDATSQFAELFIANSVTLSTRVRIEILRAISKVLVTDETESFVQGFTSRPLLHYYMREGSTAYMEGVNRTYTFVEAVAKFGALVPQAGLLQAYKRARPAFIGCLEQYFVILNENGPDVTPTRGSNSYPIGARGGFGLGRQIGRGRGRPGLRSQRGRGTPIRGRGRPTIVRGLHDSRKRPSEEAPNSSGTPSKRVPPPASQTIDSIPMDETDSVAVENIFD